MHLAEAERMRIRIGRRMYNIVAVFLFTGHKTLPALVQSRPLNVISNTQSLELIGSKRRRSVFQCCCVTF
jgi:hypothetical protein